MCIYIGIEELAANALIEILSENENIKERFVSYDMLEQYGMEVVRLMNEKGEKAVLVLSREETRKMLRDYSSIFEEKNVNGNLGIYLRENVTLDQLIDKFRGYLTIELLLAFMDKTTLKKLGLI